MPLIHRILYAIRTLTEDEPPPQSPRQQATPQRNGSRHKQAVNMVLTFRDLFAAGGLNFLLEDNHQSSNKKSRSNNSSLRKSNNQNSNSGAMSPNFVLEPAKKFVVDLPEEGVCQSVNFSTDGRCLPLKSEQLVPSANFSTDDRRCLPFKSDHLVPSANSRPFKTDENTVALVHEQRIITSPELCIDRSESKDLQVFRMGRRNKRRKAVTTVPLCPEDENKTVAALRKVLKWSPTKQNLATFAVSLPKEEEHRVVAVVQNAVNRVKEEQQRKKKRKLKLFKLTFC